MFCLVFEIRLEYKINLGFDYGLILMVNVTEPCAIRELGTTFRFSPRAAV